MLASLVVLATLGSASPPSSATIPWIQLQPTAAKTISASLLVETAPATPAIFEEVLLGDLRIAMANEMTRFANEILPEEGATDSAGSGDDVGGLALLCGILGFFPGFGIGHLVAGNINGFILFLIVDIVIAGVFFIVFPVFYFPFWYVASLVAILVERVVEAFLAADSAVRYRGNHEYRSYGDASGAPAVGPLEHLPNIKPAFTLLNF